MLSTYDWTDKKANITSKAIEELPPHWTLNVTASNAGSAANKSNPRKVRSNCVAIVGLLFLLLQHCNGSFLH